MNDLLELAQDKAIEKLAAVGVTSYGQLRPKPKKRRKPKLGKATAVIMPEEQTPDFWATPSGAYLRGGTLGAGTTTGLGWALGGAHWSGRTPLFTTRAKALKAAQKALEIPAKARSGRIARGLALGGALAGLGTTALYRHKAKKRKAELAKMPKQLVIPIKLPAAQLAKIKTSAKIGRIKSNRGNLTALEGKIKSPVAAIPKPPGKTQKEQATKITMATSISKAAALKAREILKEIGSL